MNYFNRIGLSCLGLLAASISCADTTEGAGTPGALYSITSCPGVPFSPKGRVNSDYVKHVFYCVTNNTSTPVGPTHEKNI